MPFTGGAAPSPERYGGGLAKPNKPLLQIVYESLAAQRGSAYDQSWPPTTIVGLENLAMARAITFDLFGANERLANNFLPQKMTAIGLLPRWERILNVPPQPGDTESARRARVAAAFARIGQPNSVQPFLDALAVSLGAIYVGVTHFTPANALMWWPGNSGTTAAVSSIVGVNATITGLTNGVTPVPSAAYGNTLTLSNCANAVNNGASTITAGVSSSSVTARGPVWIAPDYGVGGTIGAPTIKWSITNPNVPWFSTIDMIAIQVNQAVAGYHNADGSPNGLFWTTLNACGAVLDAMLPAHVTWSFWVPSAQNPGHFGWYLDEPDLDLEAFDI